MKALTIVPVPLQTENISDRIDLNSSTTQASSKAVKTLRDAALLKTGGTVSGSLALNGTVSFNGTTQYKTTDSKGDASTTRYFSPFLLQGYDANGGGFFLKGANGFCAIGSGEAAEAIRTNLIEAEGATLNYGSEYLYLGSDQDIVFISGCQTWANRKTTTLNAQGELILENNIGLDIKTTAIGTAPSKDTPERGVFFRDKDGNLLGGCDVIHMASGNKHVQLFAKNSSGAYAALGVNISEAGATKIQAGADIYMDSGKVLRGNVVGNVTGTVSGNAGSATKLATARTINGVSFNGTKNIIVADDTKLPHTGGTLTNSIQSAGRGGSWNAVLTNPNLAMLHQKDYLGWFPIVNMKSNDGRAALGTYTTNFHIIYFLDTNETNSPDNQIVLNATSMSTRGTFTASAVYNAVWNDYAEFFPRGEATEAGDIIALDVDADGEVYVKATEGSECVVGVHSDTFGHLIGGDEVKPEEDFVEKNLPNYIPVGLCGRVRVKFKGTAKKGMRVVPSDTPGVGRAYDKLKDSRDSIIGYLVESDAQETIRRLMMKIC